MRLKLSQDVWVIIVLILFLALVSFFAGARDPEDNSFELTPRRTSYSSKPGGVKALYQTLGKLDYPVRRSIKPLTDQPEDGVLFIICPETAISADEWDALRGWVERGNLLILASGLESSVGAKDGRVTTVSSVPAYPSFLSPDVGSFRVPTDSVITDDEWEFEHGDLFQKPFG